MNQAQDRSNAEHPFLLRLKAETATAHAEIETTPLLARIFEPDYRLAEYARLLWAMHSYVSQLELRTALFAKALPQYGLRKKTPKLVEDCGFFGIDNGSPRPIVMPEVDSIGQALGAAYVIEGSTMGGRIILKQLKAHFPERKTLPAAFYSGYGKQTAALWSLFRAALVDQVERCPAEEDVIIDAARDTFRTLDVWLRDPLHQSQDC